MRKRLRGGPVSAGLHAAIAEGHRRYPNARQRPTYAELLDTIAHLRDELVDADEAIVLAATGVRAAIATREPPHDARAEARILGALVLGRATLRDVATLEPADFLGDGHARLFAALLVALHREVVLGVRVRPSARRDPAQHAAEAAHVRRRAVETALVAEGAFAAWVALARLPWPGACPRRDVVRVEELGKWRRGER